MAGSSPAMTTEENFGTTGSRRTIMNFGALKLAIILFGLSLLLKFQAWRHPAFRERLKEKNLTGQFIARDEEIGRWFKLQDGRITSGSGVLKDADVAVAFKNATLGAS